MWNLRTMLLLGVAVTCLAQTKSPRKLISSLDGKDLYVAYCASCHGMDAKGKGPVAAVLKVEVPNLTLIQKRRGDKFPIADLEKLIMGEADLRAAHGSREMPVWGPVFRRVEKDQDMGLVRVRRLVEYLKTLQTR